MLGASGQNLEEIDFSYSKMNYFFFEGVGKAFAQVKPEIKSLKTLTLDGWEFNGLQVESYSFFFKIISKIETL